MDHAHVQLNESIDAVFKLLVKDSKNELPTLNVLNDVLDQLETQNFFLVARQKRCDVAGSNTWVPKLHRLVFNLLRTKDLPAAHMDMCFTLARAAFDLVGNEFFLHDVKLLPLLSSLLQAQLRMVLHNPENVDEKKLATCVSLIDELIILIEGDVDEDDEKEAKDDKDKEKPKNKNAENEEEKTGKEEEKAEEEEKMLVPDDQLVTILAYQIQEAVGFAIDSLIQFADQLADPVKSDLFRVICLYLSVGGHAAFNTSKMVDLKHCLRRLKDKELNLRQIFDDVQDLLPDTE